jgi:hypothetical protein
VLYGLGTPLGNPDSPRAVSVASAGSLLGLLGVTCFWAVVLPLVIIASHSNRMQIRLGVAGALLGALLATAAITAEIKNRRFERRQSRSRKTFFFAPRQARFHRVLFLGLLVAGAIAVLALLWWSFDAGYRTLVAGAGAGSLAYFASMWFWWSSHLKRSEPAIVVDEQGIAWATARAGVHHVDWSDGPREVTSSWLFFKIDRANSRYRHPLRRRHCRIPLRGIDVFPDDLLEAIQSYSPQRLEVRTTG